MFTKPRTNIISAPRSLVKQHQAQGYQKAYKTSPNNAVAASLSRRLSCRHQKLSVNAPNAPNLSHTASLKFPSLSAAAAATTSEAAILSAADRRSFSGGTPSMTRMGQAQGNNIKILVHVSMSVCLSVCIIRNKVKNRRCPILIRPRAYLQLTVNTTCSVSRHLDLNHLVRQATGHSPLLIGRRSTPLDLSSTELTHYPLDCAG